jgi:hypothetical protein
MLAAGLTSAGVASGAQISAEDPGLETMAATAVTALQAHLPALTTWRIVAGYAVNPGVVTNISTTAIDTENGEPSLTGPVCQIAVNPGWWDAQTAPGMPQTVVHAEIMTHEVFHCFEHQIDPGMEKLVDNGKGTADNEGRWIIEGLARWVDLQLFPGTTYAYALASLTNFYKTSATGLFDRTYDAVGFWGHVQDVDPDLWGRIPHILTAGANDQNAAAFTEAVNDNQEGVLSTYGSSGFDLTGTPVGVWSDLSPLSSPQPLGAPTKVAMSTYVSLSAPYSTAQLVPAPGASSTPFMQIRALGGVYAKFGVTEQYDTAALNTMTFCTNASQACACPAGDVSTVPQTEPLPSEPDLGLAVGSVTGEVQITYLPLSTYCQPPTCSSAGHAVSLLPARQPRAGADKCPNDGETAGGGSSGVDGSSEGGSGGDFGDPHMIGFGPSTYSFQGAGEYTAVKATRGDFQIQARQQPYPGSRSVADNTAFAIRAGHSTVELDSGTTRTDHGLESGVAVYVNKHRVRASRISLPGGGHLHVSSDGLTVILRDHTTVAAACSPEPSDDPAGFCLFSVRLGHDLLGHVEGLLGSWGGPRSSEFIGGDGHKYSVSAINDDSAPVVATFGASWRITQRESLFRYPRGKNTNSYTIPGFPHQPLTVAGLPAGKATAAAKTCRHAGITNGDVLSDCVLDVGATGNAGFAAGDERLQSGTDLPATPRPRVASTPPPSPIDLGLGSAQPVVTYDPASHDTYVVWQDNSETSIDLCVVTATVSQCNGGAGPRHLVDPLASSGGAAAEYFNPQLVVQPGGQVVVVAEVLGASSNAYPAGYAGAGVVAWSSPAGGSAFAAAGQGIADGGSLLADSLGTGDAPSAGAVALDPTNIGVYGDLYPYGSGFTDFTLGGPAPSVTPVLDSTGDFGQQGGITSHQLASIPDPSAAGQYIVVGVGGAIDATTGCPAGTSRATGYGVGVGTPAALQTQSAWSTAAFAPISCQAFSPVLAGGGPTGGVISLLEDEGSGLGGSGPNGVYYRAFNPTTRSFSAPVLVSSETSLDDSGATELSLAQDGAGGLYAAWHDSRGSVLSYRSSAGASWPAARTIPLPADADDAVVAGIDGGAAELAYTASSASGTQEHLVALTYIQLAGS